MDKNTAFLSLMVAAVCMALVGCDAAKFSDKEMKGILTIHHNVYGSDKLEINDHLITGETRFLYPGRKIIEIDPGMNETKITIMDSVRVELASFYVPSDGFNSDTESFHFKDADIKQEWDLDGSRKKIWLRIDHIPLRNSESCTVPPQDCDAGNPKNDCRGIIGPGWQLEDTRFDYEVQFMFNGQAYGEFRSAGETKTSIDRYRFEKCVPRSVDFGIKEGFDL